MHSPEMQHRFPAALPRASIAHQRHKARVGADAVEVGVQLSCGNSTHVAAANASVIGGTRCAKSRSHHGLRMINIQDNICRTMFGRSRRSPREDGEF